MSHGPGSMQRHILSSLQTLRGEAPPLSWYEKEALGIGSSASEGSSFRRAAKSLENSGKIQIKYAHIAPLNYSRNTYYRTNRPYLSVKNELHQGRRTRIMVRLPPTPEEYEDYSQVQESLDQAFAVRGPGAPPWAQKYISWYYERPDGIWAEEFLGEADPSTASLLEMLRRALLDER